MAFLGAHISTHWQRWLCIAIALFSGAVYANPNTLSNEDPVLLEAQDVGYDQQKQIVVARGAVEVVQGDTILRANQLTYYQGQNVIRASGNVSVLQPTGDVYFAENVELTENLKQGVIKQFRARLSDNSVFAAREAKRFNAYQSELKQAVYSPCKLCKGEDPFWQLKASRVKIDQLEETITYQNARMELMGVPVFYTPFLSHPTPDADAKSGFLIPEYSQSSLLGTTVKVPYYWRIAPNQDATITPWYTSDDGPLLAANYNHLLDNGSFKFSGSATEPSKRNATGQKIDGDEFRGHVYGLGNYYFSDHWQTGFDVNVATDDTYLRRYNFGSQNVLFSRGYVEGAKGRNYALLQGLHIQGLRATDDPDTTPQVFPTVEGYYETNPFASGARLFTGANAQYLSRNQGVDQQRFSTTSGATVPVVTDGGQVFTATASLRNDVYKITDAKTALRPQPHDENETRNIPQAALEWRYPLMRHVDDASLTVEPVVLAVAQPTGNNQVVIPNEDNRLTELTDTNLFAINRFGGLDTVDSGSRVAYGLRGNYLMAGGDAIDALLGQNYNTDADTPFPNSDEAGRHLSDLIGRIAYLSSPFTLSYRFALDQETFHANRNEISSTVNYRGAYLQTAYLTLEDNRFVSSREEAYVNSVLPLYAGWSLQGGMRRDLRLNQMVNNQLGLLYTNECFNMLLGWDRSFTRDRDIEPNTTFSLKVGFQNLGEFGGK
jgi:LPS-assembly protein